MQKGGGKFTALLLIAVVGTGIYAGYKFSLPYIHYLTIKKNLTEAVRETIKYVPPSGTEDEIRRRLDLWGIQYNPSSLYVWDEEGFRCVKLKYIEKVNLFGRWEFIYEFEPQIKMRIPG